MTAKPLSDRERQLAMLRDVYAKAAQGPIQGAIGAHGLSLLAMVIMLLETGWDERTKQAVADGDPAPSSS
ncbi:hypothetical protein ACFQE0_01260 [Methylobacterium komagatae]|uniref:Uncharacterized protein n=1 Tax=Methylobacterium komagatae TaxID=374425 RepID=A0ABW2BE27_9HYPH